MACPLQSQPALTHYQSEVQPHPPTCQQQLRPSSYRKAHTTHIGDTQPEDRDGALGLTGHLVQKTTLLTPVDIVGLRNIQKQTQKLRQNEKTKDHAPNERTGQQCRKRTKQNGEKQSAPKTTKQCFQEIINKAKINRDIPYLWFARLKIVKNSLFYTLFYRYYSIQKRYPGHFFFVEIYKLIFHFIGNTKDLYSQNNHENKDQSWRIYIS